MAKQKISGGNDPQGHHEFSLLVNLTGMMVTLPLNVDYTTGINKMTVTFQLPCLVPYLKFGWILIPFLYSPKALYPKTC